MVLTSVLFSCIRSRISPLRTFFPGSAGSAIARVYFSELVDFWNQNFSFIFGNGTIGAGGNVLV
jgi:hypothetical protein